MSTPPLLPTDLSGDPALLDPLWVPIEPVIEPPSPPTGSPRPSTPPPGLIPQVLKPSPKGPDPAEVRALKEASMAGCLQDVHQILSQYILTQSPDPITGRLSLHLFHEAISAAIAFNHTSILSYLFFMRVGEPSDYVYSALRKESSSVFRVLLEYGWNINQPLEETRPPALGYVSHNRNLTEWFLDHGADPNAMCAWDITPMSEAMYHASLDTIKMLFERGGDIRYGQLLHHAVLREGPDTVDLVSLLLDLGAPINDIQYHSHPQSYKQRYAFALGTPLHYAAEEGKRDLVLYLLQRGADPSIKNTKGKTVLETAQLSQKLEVVNLLEEKAKDVTVF